MKIRLTETQLKEYIGKIVSEQNVQQQPQVQRPQVQQQKPQSGMTQAMLNSPYGKETKIWSDFFNKYYKMNLPVDGNWKNPEYNKTLARYYKEKNIPVYVCQTNDSYCGSGSEGVVTTKDKTGGELRAIRQQDMTKLGGQQPQPVNEGKKVIRLTESDLKKYISNVVSEQVKQPTGDFTTIGRFGTSDAKTLKERGFTVKGGVAILNHPHPKLVVTVKPSQKGWAVYQGGVLKFDLPHDDCDVQLDKLIGYNSLHGGYKTGLKEQDDTSFLDNKVNYLIQQGYKVVDKISLPDGEYNLSGFGYTCYLNKDNKNTGFVYVTTGGIRGSWENQKVNVMGGKIQKVSMGEVYKMLYNQSAAQQ